MYEISCFLRRIPSHLPICDMSDIRCVAYENVQIIAVVRPMFTATRRVSVISKIRDREVNLRINLHISYIDQLVMPAIFNYLIGAKNVDSGSSRREKPKPKRSKQPKQIEF